MRIYETNELYEQHSQQLKGYTDRNLANVMEDISVQSIRLADYNQTGDKDVITIVLKSKMRDYIINKTTGNIVSYIGKLSLSIMAGHFMVFKLIDGIAGQVVKVGSDRLQLFPYSFPQLWWLYTILGITIPIVVSIIIEKIRLKIIKNNT